MVQYDVHQIYIFNIIFSWGAKGGFKKKHYPAEDIHLMDPFRFLHLFLQCILGLLVARDDPEYFSVNVHFHTRPKYLIPHPGPVLGSFERGAHKHVKEFLLNSCSVTLYD